MKKKFLILLVMFASAFLLMSCFTNNNSGKKEDEKEVVNTYYNVSFLNIDGFVLQKVQYKEGETPKYTLTTPTYTDSEYTYTFKGWDKEIVAVTSDTSYIATYTKTAIEKKDDPNNGVTDKKDSTLNMEYRQSGTITYDPNNDQTVILSPATSKADGIRYSITSVNGSANNYFSFKDRSNAALTVSKDTPTGTYVVKVRVIDNGNDEYLPGDITILYTLTVTQKDVSDLTVASIEDVTYNGSAFTPEPEVTYNSIALTKGTDFDYSYSNNTNAGTATVTITGKGNYTGTKSVTFTINKRLVTLTSGLSAKVYDRTALTNSTVIVTGDGFVDGQGATYNVTGTITDVGTANNEFTYTLKEGTSTDNYNITTAYGTLTVTQKDVSNLTVASIEAVIYNGSAFTPEPEVTYNSIALTKGTDFDYSYSNNTNAGTATVTITGKGNYTGSKSVTFTINKRVVTVTWPTTTSWKYDGTDHELKAIIGNVVTGDTVDFTYSNNKITNVGTSTAIITGISNSNYKLPAAGLTKEISITKRSVTLTSATDIKVYDGTPLTNSTVTVTGDGFVDGQGATYNVTGTITDVGTANNEFTYTLNKNTKKSNYNITVAVGKLTVTKVLYTLTGNGVPSGETRTLSSTALLETESSAVSYTYNNKTCYAYNGYIADTAYANWADANAFVKALNDNNVVPKDGSKGTSGTWRLLNSEVDASSWAAATSDEESGYDGVNVLWSSVGDAYGLAYTWFCEDGHWGRREMSGSYSNNGFVVVWTQN